tara:strand:+ start:10244 stop:10780 length:537 start_codon:yes stop_codon:yes gene_type:complete
MFEHPLHPIFVHFTVALTLTGIFCYFVGRFISPQRWKKDLLVSSSWMLLFSALATVLTLYTGYLQFSVVSHDSGSHLAMVNHRYWAIGTGLLLFIVAIWGMNNYRKGSYTGIIFPLLLIILLGGLSTTAFKGGNLVYKFGLGVKSIPELRALQKEQNGSSHENILAPSSPESHGQHDH